MNSTLPSGAELLHAVLETLTQGETLLAQLSDENYMRKVPVAFNASIGGHYRHCLDHFRSLLTAAPAGDLDYDQRERGTLVENDRFAALNETRELRHGYERLDACLLARPLGVTCKTSYSSPYAQSSPSTVGREVMYAVAHAIHHYALIGILAGLMDAPLPQGFGVAPATIKFQSEQPQPGP